MIQQSPDHRLHSRPAAAAAARSSARGAAAHAPLPPRSARAAAVASSTMTPFRYVTCEPPLHARGRGKGEGWVGAWVAWAGWGAPFPHPQQRCPSLQGPRPPSVRARVQGQALGRATNVVSTGQEVTFVSECLVASFGALKEGGMAHGRLLVRSRAVAGSRCGCLGQCSLGGRECVRVCRHILHLHARCQQQAQDQRPASHPSSSQRRACRIARNERRPGRPAAVCL